MPRKPMIGKQRRVAGAELTEDQVMHLSQGWMLDSMHHPFFHLHGNLGFPFRDEEHRREVYFKHRDYLHGLAGRGHVDGVFTELKAGEQPQSFYDYEKEEIENG